MRGFFPNFAPLLAAALLFLATGCTIFPEKERTSFRTPRKRIEAMQTLASQADGMSSAQQEEVSTELAKQFTTETDPLVREHIVRTLSHYNTATAQQVLRSALKDDNTDVRVLAVQYVARNRGPETVAALSEVLQSDTDIDVRLTAVRALGEYEDKSIVPALAVALDDQDPALQFRAIESLRLVTGEDLGGDVNAWRQYVKNGVPPNQPAESIAEKLGKLRPF